MWESAQWRVLYTKITEVNLSVSTDCFMKSSLQSSIHNYYTGAYCTHFLQSHLTIIIVVGIHLRHECCVLGMGIKPGSLMQETTTLPLHQWH